MVVQFFTGERSGAGRNAAARARMASLTVGSNNFSTRIYENPPDLVSWLVAQMKAHGVKPEIEAFDLSYIHQAALMHGRGEIVDTPYIQFVLGVKNAMPAHRHAFDFLVVTVRRLLGDVPWCAAGIGRHRIELNERAAAAGGHLRTGQEDNIRLDRDRRSPSNAALIERAVAIAERHGRPPANVDETPANLVLRAA